MALVPIEAFPAGLPGLRRPGVSPGLARLGQFHEAALGGPRLAGKHRGSPAGWRAGDRGIAIRGET